MTEYYVGIYGIDQSDGTIGELSSETLEAGSPEEAKRKALLRFRNLMNDIAQDEMHIDEVEVIPVTHHHTYTVNETIGGRR